MKLDLPLFLKNAKLSSNKKIKLGAVHASVIIANPQGRSELESQLSPILAPWQRSKLKGQTSGKYDFETSRGPLTIILLEKKNEDQKTIHSGLLDDNSYTIAREKTGQFFCQVNSQKIKTMSWHGFGVEEEAIRGSFVGLEMAAYNFKSQGPAPKLTLSYAGQLTKNTVEKTLAQAMSIGKAINISRHLVNTAPSEKRPKDYAKAVKNLFLRKNEISVSVWDKKRLEKERMGMMLAVGAGSVQEPQLVQIRYRPAKNKTMAPIAFVGKGITFDTGGLNLKPGNGMRLMKKDMGGSATLVGLAHWATQSKLDIPCDFYLALAENSVDAHSFRPGDILTARNGLTIEIDNTDAEGRLVLGDTLALASQKKGRDKPRYLIDVATLTGAIKVGLGTDIGGLFSNDDQLASSLQSCSQISGDKFWRMPLMPSQRKKLKSDVADLTNSASGFGGAIRAAMFLQEFTGDIPWAHLDIYAWNDSAQGPFQASGGNGQGVQCLTQFLSQLSH